MIAFSIDVDWAPEEVIQDTLDLFTESKVKCTIFATHDSNAIKNADKDLFEIAIHPNFNGFLSGQSINPEKIIDDLLSIYPEAIGVRSHSMTQSTPLLDLFFKKGLCYDANHFLPYAFGLRPFKAWNGLVRIPYSFEDDIHYLYNRSFEDPFLIKSILNAEFVVLDFHPIHLFLNTSCEQDYLDAKSFYKDPISLGKYVQRKRPGARDLFIKLLKSVNERGIRTFKLADIALNPTLLG